MNLQVILWVSGPLPGSVHDLTAARIWGILRELAAAGIITLADKGYHGGEHALTPYGGKSKPESQKRGSRAHAALRSPGERVNAQIKTCASCANYAAAAGGPAPKALHALMLEAEAG